MTDRVIAGSGVEGEASYELSLRPRFLAEYIGQQPIKENLDVAIRAARKRGDVLAVGLNGDGSVRALKGEGRPVNREQDRAEVLAALESVDYVTIFPELRATNFLRAAQPAIYAKGGDYTPDTLDPKERAVLEKFGTRIEIIPFEKGYSTSQLLTRIGEG